MSVYHRYRTAPMQAIVRATPGGILVGRTIEVEIDFRADTPGGNGLILPAEALVELDDAMRLFFADKLLIDNEDPHADDLMKLKRIKAVDPVLFEFGTTGPQLSGFVARWVDEWLGAQSWNKLPDDDPRKAEVVLATVRVGKSEFFYDLA